jgi:hypothetical protein
MENNNLSKHQYFYSVGLSYKADAEMRVIALMLQQNYVY